jgi:hypothetical protein
LTFEVQGFRVHNEAATKQLSNCETKLSQLETNVSQIKIAIELFKMKIKATAICLPLDSRIDSDFSSPFKQFWEKQFVLFWHGSRDGFNARYFHSRCNGQANILILILDINWNIFGGFARVEWESCSWKSK